MGLAVGFPVTGFEVGDLVGCLLGLTDGFTDGRAVGLTDCFIDGRIVGLTDGFTDGRVVGKGDGFKDGRVLGVIVGFFVGLVGTREGRVEGLLERGCNVTPLRGFPLGIADGFPVGFRVDTAPN